MLRFIIKTDNFGDVAFGGASSPTINMRTIDVELPEVEIYLSEDLGQYLKRQFIGVEIIKEMGMQAKDSK